MSLLVALLKNSKRSRKLFLKRKRAKGKLWIAWSYKEYKASRLIKCITIFNKVLTDTGRTVILKKVDIRNSHRLKSRFLFLKKLILYLNLLEPEGRKLNLVVWAGARVTTGPVPFSPDGSTNHPVISISGPVKPWEEQMLRFRALGYPQDQIDRMFIEDGR